MADNFRQVSLVLAGGVALGAYEAGCYGVLARRPDLQPTHIAGASIGAVNAALIAGGPPEGAVGRLRLFWDEIAAEADGPGTRWLDLWPGRPNLHARSWLSVAEARVFGRAGVFVPRLTDLLLSRASSLYDLGPLRRTLERIVDFGQLNGGDTRVTVVTTDLSDGEAVSFDTSRGDRITPDHILASCGFVPDFAPVELGGRMLGDGAYAANAPVRAAIEACEGNLLCVLVDLFSPQGRVPRSIEEAAGRRWELLLGNQTRLALEGLAREHLLRAALRDGGGHGIPGADGTGSAGIPPGPRSASVLHLAYSAPAHETGAERTFDFSRTSIRERWRRGEADMEAALAFADEPVPDGAFVVQRIRA